MSELDTRLINQDAVEAVRAMKRDGAGPMRTLGSLTLCRSLLTAGIVDRFRVVVFPVINGQTGYHRIYDGYPEVELAMIANRTFDVGFNCSSTCPRCWTARRARGRLDEVFAFHVRDYDARLIETSPLDVGTTRLIRNASCAKTASVMDHL